MISAKLKKYPGLVKAHVARKRNASPWGRTRAVKRKASPYGRLMYVYARLKPEYSGNHDWFRVADGLYKSKTQALADAKAIYRTDYGHDATRLEWVVTEARKNPDSRRGGAAVARRNAVSGVTRQTCKACRGTGKRGDLDCKKCDGLGVVLVKRKNPDSWRGGAAVARAFRADARAGAQQVKKIRRVQSRHAIGTGTQEAGEIIQALPGGWLKVKWDNGTKPTLVKRSEIKRYPYVRNPKKRKPKFKIGSMVYSYQNRDYRAPVNYIRDEGVQDGVDYGFNYRLSLKGDGVYKVNSNWIAENSLSRSKQEINPGLMDLAGSVQAFEYLAQKAGPDRKRKRRNPKRTTLKEVNHAGTDYTNAVRTWGEHNLVTQRAFQRYYELKEKYERERGRDLAKTPGPSGKEWDKLQNPKISKRRYFASFAGQYHESFAPYFTANRRRHSQMLRQGYEFVKAVKYPSENEPSTNVYTKDGATVHLDNKGKITLNYPVTHQAPKLNPRRNPSVTEMSTRFQGAASGKATEYYASDYAPRLDFSRAGALVFLKLKGTTIRVPGAVVAIDPKTEKLWIAGSDARPMFTRKAARKGELLDYGPVDAICYLTAKKHIGSGKTFEYVHNFGEEGGKKPNLQIDHDGMPVLKGGSYRIEDRGIVN